MSWAVRRPVLALASWFVVVIAIGFASVALGGKPNDSFALPGVQSTTAQNLLEKIGGDTPGDPTGRLVWSPASGRADAKAAVAAITPTLEKVAALGFVKCVASIDGRNLGRDCPKAAPTDYAAALNAGIAAIVAKELKIPSADVGQIVTLIDSLAPLSSSDPAKLAAVASALPEIARLASAPRSVLDALAALTPQQLSGLVGITSQDVVQATDAVGGLAKFADLPPATLAALAKADPAQLAAFASALPGNVKTLEAFWTDLKAALAKDPALGPAIVAVAAKYGITPADLEAGISLINEIAPIADADPATLSAIAQALPQLATLARADKATIDALATLTPQDLSFLVGLTKQDIVSITEAFGGLAQFARLPDSVLSELAAADPAKLAAFAAALPGGVGQLESAMAAVRKEIATLDDAATAVQKYASPVSADGTVAYATVTLDQAAIPADLLGTRVDEVLAIVEGADGPTMTVGITGSTFDSGAPGRDMSVLIGLAAALVILLIAFGSLVAAGLPLVVAITGMITGLMLLAVFERFLSIASFAPTLAVMIGLGVGIDYALFVLSRFTQEVRAGADPKEAALTSVRTAGRAVLFAGSTVIIALLGMFVLGIGFFNGLGVGAAATVLMVMLSAVWMLPALLSLLGSRSMAIRMPWARHPRSVEPHDSRWSRYGGVLQRAPVVPVLVVLAIVIGLALPALRMQPGFPDDGSAPAGTPTRIGYDLMARGFGPGVNGPFFVAVQTKQDADFAALGTVITDLEKTEGVASTFPSSAMLPLLKLVPSLFVDGVTSVIVQPTTGPADVRTSELLERIRTTTTQEVMNASGADIYVGGQQAVTTDFTNVLMKALPVFLLVVIGFGFIALMILFHSLVIPLTAAITSLLSFGASLGITVAVFQLGFANALLGVAGTGPILPFLPIMVFAILFGLSMDYQVFLVTRMKEHWDSTGDNRDAVRLGLAGSGKVVVAAATIMTSVFLAFVPSSMDAIKMFGVALAAAVIVDAFLIRLVLVPSLMTLLGRANWWVPRWLDRILPKITLE